MTDTKNKNQDVDAPLETQPEPSAVSQTRRLMMRILTPILFTLVLLIIVELFLQVAMPLPFSDRLYWIPDGHIKSRLDYPQEVINTDGNPVQINEFGFRGPHWTWRPKKDTLRIAAFGGSSTFCFQVSDDAHTWPAQLETALKNKSRRSVEVVNLALPGYDTSNSKVNYLFTGRALHPDVAIIYHTWNDMKFLRPIDEAEQGATPRIALSGRPNSGTNSSVITRLFRRLQIIRRIELVRSKIAEEDRENRYTSIEKEGGRAHRPIEERGWRWFEKNFDDMVRFVQSDNVVPVLVSQASLAHQSVIDKSEIRRAINNDYIGMTHPRLVKSYEMATAIIEKVARNRGAIYINGYEAIPPDLVHLKDHVHLIDPGAKRLAEVIAAELMRNEAFTARLEKQTNGASLATR